jgi:PAS domain S-box-containing protein
LVAEPAARVPRIAVRGISKSYGAIIALRSVDLAVHSGEVLGVLGVARDITQRKATERALKESELRWQFALEGAGDGIWDWDVPKAQIFRSRSWYRLLGQQREADLQPVGSWLDAIHPDDRTAARAVIEEMLRGSRDGYSSEYRMRAGDGTWRWMLARGKVMQRDADGQALRVLGVTSDITARKQAEWALRESESLFRRLADTAPVMIWMANADHQVTYVNRTWLEFTGRALDQELGNGWVDTLHPDDRGEVDICVQAFKDGRPFRIEYRTCGAAMARGAG